jgi:NhaD family Na+/H+ antiporter
MNTKNRLVQFILLLVFIFFPLQLFASQSIEAKSLDLTAAPIGFASLIIFLFAYLLVMTEEFTLLRKSKPVILAAGIIWAMIGWVYMQHGLSDMVESAIRHNLLEYAELMLFLLVAMTYINGMQDRDVFNALRSWLIHKGFSFRQLFWVTGLLAFFISPIADNLTAALLLSAVILAVGVNNSRFVTIACINVVVGANAGGAFSPFGDITTLMVWQKGMLDFFQFFALFIPSLVNFLVPAVIMNFAIPKGKPILSKKIVIMKRGARRMIALFLLTIITAVCFHSILKIPPVVGMLTGLGYLQLLGFYLKKTKIKCVLHERRLNGRVEAQLGDIVAFDVFVPVARAEWDTLFFFYGVVLCVGGLGFLGYLSMVSELMYQHWGATYANISVGILSAIIDNIPVMFAVLTMEPAMSTGQWLLVTLTAGVGGSLLSIGSAAGVALMGQAKGRYTFFAHLKWTPIIAIGYFSSIWTHMWLNKGLF